MGYTPTADPPQAKYAEGSEIEVTISNKIPGFPLEMIAVFVGLAAAGLYFRTKKRAA